MAPNDDSEKQLSPAPQSNQALLDAQHHHGEDCPENRGLFLHHCETRNRGHLKMKIFRAVVIFTTLWLLLRFVGKHAYHKFKKCHHKGSIIEEPAFEMEDPIPPGIPVDRCADWSDSDNRRHSSLREPYSATASFDLPFPSEKLFLLSRGGSGGSIAIVQSPVHGEGDDAVRVKVTARYHFPSALDYVRVCSITREGDENGIGIFSPEWLRHFFITFDVTVYLPKSSGTLPLHVKNFETDMPFFSHYVDALAETVNFDLVSLRTANAPIHVESLHAVNADVETANSPIEGSFDTSSSLKLITADARIKANVRLFNDADTAATSLIMNTRNAPVDATLSLISTSTEAQATFSNTGGKFQVAATTERGPVDIVFAHAPVDSALTLDAHTSFSDAYVTLHETYEGNFSLTTTFYKPDVYVDKGVEDPAGKKRGRFVDIEKARIGKLEGSVRWGEEDGAEKGVVNIETSFGQVRLWL